MFTHKIKDYIYILSENEVICSLYHLSDYIRSEKFNETRLIKIKNFYQIYLGKYNCIVYDNKFYEITQNFVDIDNKRNVIFVFEKFLNNSY